jgi:site-specific DNA recombinase
MKCAIYVRVSTDEQAKAGYSLAAQVDSIKSFIKSQGWAACEIYSDDGYSAKDRKRPALKRLIDDASEKRFDVVLVYKIDRLSRRLKDLIEIVEELSHYNVGFKSITELIDTTTPEGRLMFHQFGSFAQYERELIGQRTKMGMLKRLKEGKWNGSPTPYGYKRIGDTLQIKEREAKIIRLIYDLADKKNIGVINIARYLNEQHIKGIRVDRWRQNTVYSILTNPVYTGIVQWGGERVAGAHKPIIKDAQFEKIRKDLKIRKAKTRALVSPNLLTGLIYCKCSSAMHVLYPGIPPKNRYRYYVCTDRAIHKTCKTDYVRADLLEQAVVDKLKEFYSDEKLFTDAINNLKNRGMAELPALKCRKTILAKKVLRLSRQKDGLLKWMGDRGVKPYTLNAINEKMERLEPELNESKYELMKLDEACEKIPALACSSKNIARDVLKSLANFTDFSFGERKRLLSEVIHKIKVDSKEEVHLFLKRPAQISLGLTVQYGSPNRIVSDLNSKGLFHHQYYHQISYLSYQKILLSSITFFVPSLVGWVYMLKESMSLCPVMAIISRGVLPCLNRVVTNECRKSCGVRAAPSTSCDASFIYAV